MTPRYVVAIHPGRGGGIISGVLDKGHHDLPFPSIFLLFHPVYGRGGAASLRGSETALSLRQGAAAKKICCALFQKKKYTAHIMLW